MGNTYRITEIVGTSDTSVDDAIRTAVARAATTLRGLNWFEVANVRGRIENDGVQAYQVELRVGFRLDTE